MMTSLTESLRALQDPARRDGADLRPVLDALNNIAAFTRAQRSDREDLVQRCLVALIETPSRFRERTDAEARAYLRRTLERRAIDGLRDRKRESRRRDALELRCVGVVRHSNERAVVMAIELRQAIAKTSRAMRDRGIDAALVEHLNALGMLEWTKPATMSEGALAESLRTTPNALQARRSRVRKAIATVTAQLVRQRAMDESERNAMLALVAPR